MIWKVAVMCHITLADSPEVRFTDMMLADANRMTCTLSRMASMADQPFKTKI
jgi:hypothetical protein